MKNPPRRVNEIPDPLTPQGWEMEYKKGNPHWAEDKDPSKFAQEFVDTFRERGLKTILEIGCGNGRDSIFFAHANLKPTCIDVSPSAVKLAKTNFEEANVPVKIQVANAEKLPFEDNEFDGVFSLSVLHSTDLNKSLKEVFRVLKPKGLAFIYIYGSTQIPTGEEKDIIDLDAYLVLLQKVGFKIDDFYSEDEEEFDESGEKHKLFVSYLEKEES